MLLLKVYDAINKVLDDHRWFFVYFFGIIIFLLYVVIKVFYWYSLCLITYNIIKFLWRSRWRPWYALGSFVLWLFASLKWLFLELPCVLVILLKQAWRRALCYVIRQSHLLFAWVNFFKLFNSRFYCSVSAVQGFWLLRDFLFNTVYHFFVFLGAHFDYVLACGLHFIRRPLIYEWTFFRACKHFLG